MGPSLRSTGLRVRSFFLCSRLCLFPSARAISKASISRQDHALLGLHPVSISSSFANSIPFATKDTHCSILITSTTAIMKVATSMTMGSALLLAIVSAPLSALARPHKVDRSEYLANVNSIHETLVKYAHVLDDKELDALDEVFTEDGAYIIPSLDIDAQGIPAIVEFEKSILTLPGVTTMHQTGTESYEINLKKGTAKTVVYLDTAINGYKVNSTMHSHVVFDDELVRVKNGDFYPELQWRIKKRSTRVLVCSFHLSFSSCLPLPPFGLSSPCQVAQISPLHI